MHNIKNRFSRTDGIIAFLLALTLIGLVLTALAPAPEAHAGGQSLGCFDSAGNKCGSNATSTVAYLSTSATTTLLTFAAPNAQSFDLNFSVTASSTSSILQYQIYGSRNAVDWYVMDGPTSAAGVTTHKAGFNVFTPGATATTSLEVSVSLAEENFYQIRASAAAAAAAVYVQAITNNVLPN